MNFLLGSDPEVIIGNEESPVSAAGILGASKHEPLKLRGLAFHEDNILLEFNIPPAKNKEEFVASNQKALRVIEDEFLRSRGLKILPVCQGVFSQEEILHPQAQEIGCEPEYNAYSKGVFEHEEFGMRRLRTAGGHVHIGYEGETEFKSIRLIRLLDLHLGLPSIIMEEPNQRRLMYGQAGSYRRTPKIKVEYRTPSNFWLWKEELMEWIYDTVAKVLIHFKNGDKLKGGEEREIIRIINDHDVASATALCKKLKLNYLEKEVKEVHV